MINKQLDSFFNDFIDLQTQTFIQITIEWGYSTVALKNWLNKYYPVELDKNYSRKAEINADIFLPPRPNALWSGDVAIYRLGLAMKAKAIIIFSNFELNEKDQQVIYKTECLRLWLRINSLNTKFTFEQFKLLLNKSYQEVITNWDKEEAQIIELQNVFKPRRKQTLYHYTDEDFDSITPTMTLNEAYYGWINYQFPTLLSNYKNNKIKQFIQESKNNAWSIEFKQKKYNKLVQDLNLIQIKQPSIEAFRKLLQRFNIKYKQRN